VTRPALAYGVRAAWSRRRRLLPLVFLLAVGIGIVAATTGIASRADSAAQETAERDGAGRIVEVENVQASGGSAGRLTTATLERIGALPGVSAIQPASEVPLGLKTADIPGVLMTGTTLQTSRPPMIKPAGDPPRLERGQVLLPDSAQGSSLAGVVGSEQEFETQRATAAGQGVGQPFRLRIVGTYDPSYQVDGRDVAYLSLADAERLAADANDMSVEQFRREVGFDSAQIVAVDEAAVPRILAAVQGLGLAATTLTQRYSELPTVLTLARVLGSALGILLVIVIGAAAATQTALSVRSRWNEIGVLRAVGYGRRDTMLAFAVEAMLATVAGVALGILLCLPLSLGLVRLLGDTADEAHLTGSSLPTLGPVALFAALTLAAGCLGALFAARRAARLDPSTVLRAQ
jgi:putative ABC transport system permease protein